MIHYNVWFNLKEGVEEQSGLGIFRRFLGHLCENGEAAAYRILRNSSDGDRTKLPRYQAIIEFESDAALAEAMKRQAARGIHSGGHGAIVNIVSEFRVEVFRLIEAGDPETRLYACEI